MWRKIAVAVMLTILLSCHVNSIASASANKPSLGTTYITVQWDPPEPEFFKIPCRIFFSHAVTGGLYEDSSNVN